MTIGMIIAGKTEAKDAAWYTIHLARANRRAPNTHLTQRGIDIDHSSKWSLLREIWVLSERVKLRPAS